MYKTLALTMIILVAGAQPYARARNDGDGAAGNARRATFGSQVYSFDAGVNHAGGGRAFAASVRCVGVAEENARICAEEVIIGAVEGAEALEGPAVLEVLNEYTNVLV